MTQIEEFTKEYIDKNTPEKDMLFKSFLDSQEPYTSIFKNNLKISSIFSKTLLAHHHKKEGSLCY